MTSSAKSVSRVSVVFFLLVTAAACAQNQLAQAVRVTDLPFGPPPVPYPADAKKARIEGTVELEIAVSASGEVTAVRAVSGPLPLRQAAVDAYRHANYQPLVKDGQPVPALLTTSVVFTLPKLVPSDSDQQLYQSFAPLHERCQQLSAQNDPEAVSACKDALIMANRFSPSFERAVHATAYNDLVLALIAAKRKPDATKLAEDAVVQFVDPNVTVTDHSPAAATAYITRAEIRSLTGDLKGSEADCLAAEEVERTLLTDGTEQEVDKAAHYRQQLRETMRLRAVVLDQLHRKSEANQVREQALHI